MVEANEITIFLDINKEFGLISDRSLPFSKKKKKKRKKERKKASPGFNHHLKKNTILLAYITAFSKICFKEPSFHEMFFGG